MKIFIQMSVFLLSFFSLHAFTDVTIYDFENGDTQSWSGSQVRGGPWSVEEWALTGNASLKADINLMPGGKYYLKLTQEMNLATANFFEATIHRSAWGNVGTGLHARLYLKTGEDWAWHASPSQSVNHELSGLTLRFNLSDVTNLSMVRELGIEFIAGAESSGRASIYADNILLESADVKRRTPLWTLASHYATFDKSAYPYLLKDNILQKLDRYSGEPLWEYRYQESGGYIFDNAGALYVTDNNQFIKLHDETASIIWQIAVKNRYISLLSSDENTLYIKDGETLISINRHNGDENWRYQLGSVPKVFFDDNETIYICSGLILTGINRVTGKAIWQFNSVGHPYVNVSKQGDIFLRNGSDHNVLQKLDGKTGHVEWSYVNSEFIDNLYFNGKEVVYFSSGGYYDRVLYSLDREHGKLNWKSATYEFFRSSYSKQDLVFLHRGSTSLGLDKLTGQAAWHYENSEMTLDRFDNLYLQISEGASDRFLKLNKVSGIAQWEYETQNLSFYQPITLHDGQLLLGKTHGLVKLDNVSGGVLWEYFAPDAFRFLSFDNDAIFIAPTGLTVESIDLDNGNARWQANIDKPVHFKHSDNELVYFEYDSSPSRVGHSGPPHGLVVIEK